MWNHVLNHELLLANFIFSDKLFGRAYESCSAKKQKNASTKRPVWVMLKNADCRKTMCVYTRACSCL